MAWWQKKILRYALSRTGFLDDDALDLDNLDIALGRKNVVELKDVGLNIKRISKLAQLPPSLRIETARIISLRLTVPADIYQSSIVAEVDGVDLSLRLEEQEDKGQKERKSRAKSPTRVQTPQHRKVHRRLRSPPPYDPGGLSDGDDTHLPTTEELAKSFLQEEPLQERKDLEASVVGNTKGLEESIVSESSEGDDYGMGGAIGLPGFLAGFLQGILDRLQISIKNLEATLETEVAGDGQDSVPVTLRLHIASVDLPSVPSDPSNISLDHQNHANQRQVIFNGTSLQLQSNAEIFSELSELPSYSSPAESRRREQSPQTLRKSESDGRMSEVRPSTSSTSKSFDSGKSTKTGSPSPKQSEPLSASIMTADADRFADAGEDESPPNNRREHPDLEIQPGDDNISWGSRRSKSSHPVQDLWNSMASEDDLPDSLLFERVSTPRAQTSRDGSPRLARSQRDPSPYRRSLQSPGSWPTLEEGPEHHHSQKSPGSWPTLDQSQHSMFQPLTPGLEASLSARDNKKAALEATTADLQGFETPPEPEVADMDDLTTSRVFSHEEAESMYMSAMSHDPQMHVPGGWSPESARSKSPEATRHDAPVYFRDVEADRSQLLDDNLAYGEQPYNTPSGNVTPRAQSTGPSNAISGLRDSHSSKATRELLFVSSVSVWLPVTPNNPEGQETERSAPIASSASFHPHGMPGTFSMYSERSASVRAPPGLSREHSSSVVWTAELPAAPAKAQEVQVDIANIKCQVDMPCARLMHRFVSKVVPFIKTAEKPSAKQKSAAAAQTQSTVPLSLSIQDVQIAFMASANIALEGADLIADSMVSVQSRNVTFSNWRSDVVLRIGDFSTFIGESRFLSFNRSRDIKSSVQISQDSPDIQVTYEARKTVTTRSVYDLNVVALPLDVLLDLQALDDAFSTFGGLSGVLEVGNSVLSESGITSSPSSPSRPTKGVRFEGDPQYIGSEPELKVNARIGGVCATLRGTACHVQLQTSAVTAGYRAEGASVSMAQVILTGPHMQNNEDSPISLDLSTLRLDYLFSPQDRDLERLLTLLTPSNDKYGDNDDILLDTLLRQRRKGAVLRLSVNDIKFKASDWTSLGALTDLGNELGKLSAVAKYLPEDDRPGLLTLVRIKDCEARLPVNNRFGNAHLNVSDFHCAHVGLPALLALSVGNVSASQNQELTLLHALSNDASSESLPMVMVRMLGDEVEPTIKVKVFNVCLEYSVPIVLAMTDLGEDADTEDVVAELAKSVVDLAVVHEQARQLAPAPSNASEPLAKKTKIDLLVHDSAIGLTPQRLPSKAMLVLTDARFSTTVPPEDPLAASLELRKAGLFVTDNATLEHAHPAVARVSPSNTATKAKLTLDLSKQGFVSVGSIMSARVSAQISQSNGSQSVKVDVRNELLLLETCADSTQMLIATLNSLTPPTPPSKQPKYLTEPMTIEDMMASFTGEAYAKLERPPETLFDVEETAEDPDLMLDIPTLNEEDDAILAESEMTSSLYGPVSGILGVDQSEDDDVTEGFGETAESLLEDDPFEMPASPEDTKLSDTALIRELNKQCKPAVRDDSVDLGLYEIEDLGFEALGSGQNVLGNHNRFNNPTSTRRSFRGTNVKQDLPFTLRLRDLHIIWNIYDGYDWQKTRDGISEAVEQVEAKVEERTARRRQSLNEREDDESVIGDFLFNSIYIGVPSNLDAQELRRQINRNIDDLATETESVPVSGMSRPTNTSTSARHRQRPRRRLKLERSKAHKVAFELKGVSADVVVFPPDSPDVVSSVDVRIKHFEIFDNVPTSTWRKFLTHLSSDASTREMSKPMMHIELLNVRTLENYAASEIVLHVNVLPLRLHVDQDCLDFITRFFEFKDERLASADAGGDQPFLQRVEIDTVDMCLDYKPKKVDYAGIRSGHTTEFMNFIILDAANIRLNHAIVYGIKGFEPLHKTLNDVWMPDIKRNQLPTVLAGLAPVRSLVNIGSGFRDVVAIPVREYQKDGRIVRSIQKGAFQFGKTTASELARLGAKVAIGTQNLLQGAEGFLTPTSDSPGRPSPVRARSSDHGWHDVDEDDQGHEARAISAYANQPLNVLSGLRSARRYIEHDLLTARDALIAVQGEVLESASPGSAAAAVVRHAPTVILRPIIGTSRAVGTALLGVGNQIDGANIRKVDDKYKSR